METPDQRFTDYVTAPDIEAAEFAAMARVRVLQAAGWEIDDDIYYYTNVETGDVSATIYASKVGTDSEASTSAGEQAFYEGMR